MDRTRYRGALARSLVVWFLIVLAACASSGQGGAGPDASAPAGSGSASPTNAPSSTRTPAPSAPAPGPVAITTVGGDAWSWREPIHGSDRRGCDQITMTVNGAAVSADVATRGRRFSASVPLDPGKDLVKARCGGRHRAISNAVTFDERLRPRPVARTQVSVTRFGVSLDASTSREDPADPAPIVAAAWRARPGNPGPLASTDGRSLKGWVSGSSIQLQTPNRDGQYFVTVRVRDAEGRSDEATATFSVRNGHPVAVNPFSHNPSWVTNAVVYGVVPFLFGPHGLNSVRARLPYLHHLGINVIWLSPIFRHPASDYGYAVTDLFRIDPSMGTAQDLTSLVRKAHHLGIRVLLDFPVNDTSNRSPYFRDTEVNGRNSPYYHFYQRSDNGQPVHYFNWKNLPNLNYANPQVRRMVVAAGEYWVRRFNIDGYRLDAAWGVRQRYAAFWPHFARQLRRIKPDLLLLAEGSARDPYYFENGFDAAYDWTNNVGQWAWSSVWSNSTAIAPYLTQALTNAGAGYPPGLVFRFLNNNDTGARFIQLYGPKMTRAASALLLTLPGIPELFTGDEVGAAYMPYTQTTPISWTDHHDLRPYYRRLIKLRERLASLHSAHWHLLQTGSVAVLSYVRWSGSGGKPALVVVNFGPKIRTTIQLGDRASLFTGRRLTDQLSGATLRPVRGRTVNVQVPAWSGMVLVPRGGPR